MAPPAAGPEVAVPAAALLGLPEPEVLLGVLLWVLLEQALIARAHAAALTARTDRRVVCTCGHYQLTRSATEATTGTRVTLIKRAGESGQKLYSPLWGYGPGD